jgi:hypothetical protein
MRPTSAILQDLAERIRAIESSRRSPTRTLQTSLLAPLLAGGDLPAGSLVELLPAADGAGAWTLALLLARDACAFRRALVIIDAQGWFYPPAASKLGIDLEHTIIVRPARRSEIRIALDQSLRCLAVGAVLAVCDQLRGVESQRVKWAAEAGDGLGLLVHLPSPPIKGGRKGTDVRGPSFADLRLVVAPFASDDTLRRVRVEAVRWRGGKEGEALMLEIDDETGHVCVPAELASAETRAPARRAARAAGRSG